MSHINERTEDDILRIDRNNPVPLHLQVEKALRELILLPEYAVGNYLPDEKTLAMKFGLSRMTLRAGMVSLLHEGLLERRRGIGTRVANQSQQSGLGDWYSLRREMARKGIAVTNFSLSLQSVKATTGVAKSLEIEEGRVLFRLERLRGWNGIKVTLMTSWLHPRLNLKGNEDFSGSLSETVERATGVRICRTREEVAATRATRELAKRLEVEVGSPLLYRSQLILDAGDKPVFYNENYYRGDMFALSLDVKRSQ